MPIYEVTATFRIIVEAATPEEAERTATTLVTSAIPDCTAESAVES